MVVGEGMKVLGILAKGWGHLEDIHETLRMGPRESFEHGGQEHPRQVMENFRNTLDHCGFDDLGFLSPQFTWSNKRDVGKRGTWNSDRGRREDVLEPVDVVVEEDVMYEDSISKNALADIQK
ncbi:hypothetical protein Q3G72_025246 [Acer saccharum]|nr:hypothetical protein Q3G72_025246 [Acer saccharum]